MFIEADDKTRRAIVAAQELCGTEDITWQAIGSTLLTMLDHSDLNMRASAAAQLGNFCRSLFCNWSWCEGYADEILDYDYQIDGTWKWVFEADDYENYEQSIIGTPAFADIMHLIQTKEIERPGVAGAWLLNASAGLTDLEINEWILTTLENSPHPEPYIPDFPVNLAFHAHEIFSRDADVIRRFMTMGRSDIAIMAATEESEKIQDLEPLLMELGYEDNPEIVRLASWHLAYHYHILHPKGAELGYVELVRDRAEIDVFLLFSRREELESPYAVVIYPKSNGLKFTRSIAQQWVNQIFPERIRGNFRHYGVSYNNNWYEGGYIEYYPSKSSSNLDTDLIDQIIIGYRSSLPWNPKTMLFN